MRDLRNARRSTFASTQCVSRSDAQSRDIVFERQLGDQGRRADPPAVPRICSPFLELTRYPLCSGWSARSAREVARLAERRRLRNGGLDQLGGTHTDGGLPPHADSSVSHRRVRQHDSTCHPGQHTMISLSQTTSATAVDDRSHAATTPETFANNYYRVFVLSSFGITTDFHVTQVSFPGRYCTGDECRRPRRHVHRHAELAALGREDDGARIERDGHRPERRREWRRSAGCWSTRRST